MSKSVHRVYIAILVTVVVLAVIGMAFMGMSYYQTGLEERFYHEDHQMLKPSGAVGHGLGIIGTLLIIIGVSSYIIRKRNKRLRRLGVLKHWLEFHIFLCTLGPFMVLFHTAFKFGGIVSISFWSMVGVVLSGVLGRFIYIQIPRTIEGRELSLDEVRGMQFQLGETLKGNDHLDSKAFQSLIAETVQKSQPGFNPLEIAKTHWNAWYTLRRIKSILKGQNLDRDEYHRITGLVKQEISLNHRIGRLETMQKLFKYWHVAHLPFALIMLIIMVIHVAVTLTFGYRWIF